eukprot:1642940-Rhodomonas_salina.1
MQAAGCTRVYGECTRVVVCVSHVCVCDAGESAHRGAVGGYPRARDARAVVGGIVPSRCALPGTNIPSA